MVLWQWEVTSLFVHYILNNSDTFAYPHVCWSDDWFHLFITACSVG